MVVDSSALMAILLGEPEAESFARLIAVDGRRLVSAFSVFETSAVLLGRKGPDGLRMLDSLLQVAGIETAAFEADQAQIARQAYEQFGKGRHPAALNLGDCCSYALARHAGEPLLFKGGDFALTDIEQVLDSR